MEAAKSGYELGHFGMAYFNSLGCDVESSARQLAQKCPFLSGSLAATLVDDALSAVEEVEQDWNEETAYMFVLARNAIGRFDRSERLAVGRKLSPLGLLFADLLIQGGMLDSQTCGDAQMLAIDFEAKWADVRFGKGEKLMGEMLARAKKEMLPIDGPTHLRLLVSIAWHLQKWVGKQPIYLPVNEEFAATLGVTPMTVSKLVRIAESRAYLIAHKPYVAHVQARTWFFNLGHEEFKGLL